MSNYNQKKTIVVALLIGVAATVFLVWNNQRIEKAKQENIKRILTEITAHFSNHNYQKCLEIAESSDTLEAEVPPEELMKLASQCRLAEAKRQAQQLNYTEALKIAGEIPDYSRNYQTAQEDIDKWSFEVLKDANDKYEEEGKLEDALKLIQEIPPHSSLRKKAEQLGTQWQQEYKINERLIRDAETFSAVGQWEKAIEQAIQVKRPKYLVLKAIKIAQKAEAELHKEGKRVIINPNPQTQSSNGSQSKPEHCPPEVICLDQNDPLYSGQ